MADVTLSKSYAPPSFNKIVRGDVSAVTFLDGDTEKYVRADIKITLNGNVVTLSFIQQDLKSIAVGALKDSLATLIESKLNADGTLK